MPMQRDLYPDNWDDIAEQLKEAAHWTCQWCGARRGQQRPNRHGELVDVVITVAHLDHDPGNPNARLAVLCTVCHIRYDTEQRARKCFMMQIARGQLVLPLFAPGEVAFLDNVQLTPLESACSLRHDAEKQAQTSALAPMRGKEGKNLAWASSTQAKRG